MIERRQLQCYAACGKQPVNVDSCEEGDGGGKDGCKACGQKSVSFTPSHLPETTTCNP